MRILFYLFLISLTFSYGNTSDSLDKFNITIKVPVNASTISQTAYKSIHVKYTLLDDKNRWNIVGIEPFIQISEGTIQQITVHICQEGTYLNQRSTIWFDDETYCDNAQSMIIYHWTSSSSLSPFQISDDLGFQFDKTKSIVLSITYSEERLFQNDQSGVILYISTLIPRSYIGTIFVGNKQQRTRFSCRSTGYPRLLYGVKSLFANENNPIWRINIIRVQRFSRNIVRPVLDSSIISKQNNTNIDIISSEIFFKSGDYLMIECESNCNFLIYYTYKTFQYAHIIEYDYVCQNNNYPDLFRSVSSGTLFGIEKISPSVSNINGGTIFRFICLFLFIIWILIIIGCIIMRRVRGLVNYRTEPTTLYSSQKTKLYGKRRGDDQNRQRTATAGEAIAQLDVEHMGLMS